MQAARADSNRFLFRHLHLIRPSVLRPDLDHLGKLRRRENQKLWEQHKVSALTSSGDNNLHIFGRCGCSWTRTVHQLVRCFLLKHLGTRVPSNYGTLRFVARQTRNFKMDHVERHRPRDLRYGWTCVRDVLITHQHNCDVWRQLNLINASHDQWCRKLIELKIL